MSAFENFKQQNSGNAVTAPGNNASGAFSRFQSNSAGSSVRAPKKVDKKKPKTVGQAFKDWRAQGAMDQTRTGLDFMFGGGVVGEKIGSMVARSGLTGLSKEERQYVDKGPSSAQIKGDILKMGTVLGSSMIPAARGLSLPAIAGRGALIGAAQGGALTAAEGLRKEGEVSAKEVATGALIGGATGAAFDVGAELISRAGRSLYGRILNFTQKDIKQELRKDVAQHLQKITNVDTPNKPPPTLVDIELSADPIAGYDKKTLTAPLLKRGSVSTARGLNREIAVMKDQLYKNRKNILSTVTDRYDGGEIYDQTIARTVAEYGDNIDPGVIEKILAHKSLPTKALRERRVLTIAEADKLREILSKDYVNNKVWINTGPEATKVKVLKNLYEVLSENIKKAHPDLPGNFAEHQLLINLGSVLENTISNRPPFLQQISKSGIMMGGITGAGVGLASGNPLAGALAFPVAAGTFMAGQRVLGSTPVKTAVGVGLNRLGNMALSELGGLSKEQLINLIVELSGEKKQ